MNFRFEAFISNYDEQLSELIEFFIYVQLSTTFDGHQEERSSETQEDQDECGVQKLCMGGSQVIRGTGKEFGKC